MSDKDYPLTVEILTDCPCGAALLKGQVCKARYISKTNSGFFILDPKDTDSDWSIGNEDAKVVNP